jgi:hypothetical protein
VLVSSNTSPGVEVLVSSNTSPEASGGAGICVSSTMIVGEGGVAGIGEALEAVAGSGFVSAGAGPGTFIGSDKRGAFSGMACVKVAAPASIGVASDCSFLGCVSAFPRGLPDLLITGECASSSGSAHPVHTRCGLPLYESTSNFVREQLEQINTPHDRQ